MGYIALISASIAWGIVYGQWIEPILKKRWAFYPEEILYTLGYVVILCLWDALFAEHGLTWFYVVFNVLIGIAVTFTLRQLTYASLKMDGLLENRRDEDDDHE